LLTIEEIKNRIKPIAKTYGIDKISLFGSYAKGEANEESDVDFYIDKGKLRSLIQYYSFVNELEKTFGCHVDVVTTGIQDKVFLSKIMEDGILIYERQGDS